MLQVHFLFVLSCSLFVRLMSIPVLIILWSLNSFRCWIGSPVLRVKFSYVCKHRSPQPYTIFLSQTTVHCHVKLIYLSQKVCCVFTERKKIQNSILVEVFDGRPSTLVNWVGSIVYSPLCDETKKIVFYKRGWTSVLHIIYSTFSFLCN